MGTCFRRRFTCETGLFGNLNTVMAFRMSEKPPFLILLAEGLALLAVERDLLAESGWVLALDGGLLAKRNFIAYEKTFLYRRSLICKFHFIFSIFVFTGFYKVCFF